MKVEIQLSIEHSAPHAVIYASEITDEVQRAVMLLEAQSSIVIASDSRERMVILKPEDIYMIRIENAETVLYCERTQYRSKKRLYELKTQLGGSVLQIAKATLVNVAYIDTVELAINGMMELKLKNGCSEYISRKYLPDFKRYLGI